MEDDHWGKIISTIRLSSHIGRDGLLGIEDFSHLGIIFYFHIVPEDQIEMGARHPRNNLSLPKVGIFAQRGKDRPNRLGSTIVELLKIEGISLTVRGLDAIDGTPVLDIKPVMKQFFPHKDIREPEWVKAVMAKYW